MSRKNKKPMTAQTENDADKRELCFREAQIEVRAADGDTPAQVRMTVSSETPVLEYVYFGGRVQQAYEILDHGEGSIDMSRCKDGLVIQDGHYGDQVGLMAVENAERKLGGLVRFCSGERAQEIAQDAADGLRRNTSVGYLVDAASYRQEGERDGIPVVRAMRWTPYEASFVPVPADTNVGVGRSLEETETEAETPPKTRSIKMSNDNKLTADEVVEVYQLARSFDMEPGAADEHIKSGKSVEEFRVLALKTAKEKLDAANKTREQKPAMPPKSAERAQVLSETEQREVQKRFSIMNVARYLDATMRGEVSKIDIGYEREVSAEMAKRTGKPAQGIYIPHCAGVAMKRADPFLKGSNGSAFVATDLLVGQFIDALRSRMVLDKAGVTTLSGLVGDVAIPKGGAITGGWVDGENGAGTEGKPTVTQVTGTPKTASGWTDISRRMLIQSSIDAEMFVQNELLNTIARLIEVAAFAGTNANGQPKGLSGATGLNTPTIATANAITRAEALSFVENIMTDNAEFDGQAWIMRPTGWANLANRLEVRGVDNAGLTTGTIVGGGPVPGYLLDVATKTMLGFPYHVTTNVPNHSLWFGAWSQLVIGLWSGADIVVDPYSSSTTGAVRIVALQDADIMVRNGQAFSYAAALTA